MTSPQILASATEYAVYLGAVDWLHENWLGVFYPEDLPEDWLLAYYNTQFHTVFLPYARWATRSTQALQSWIKDTQPGFRFFLEPPPASSPPPQADPQLLGDRLGKLAREDDPDLLWFDAHSDLRELAAEIAGRPRPLYVISRDGDLQTLERVRTLLELMGL